MLGVHQAIRCFHARPTGVREEVKATAVARAPGSNRVLTARTHLRGTEDFSSIANRKRSAMCLSSVWPASRARVLTVRCLEKPWEAKFDSSPYEVLNLSNGATDKNIKDQYRVLVKKCHPDVVKDLDKEEAEERFIQIQAAYELLSDPERRAEYDKEHRDHPLAANQAFQAYIAKRKKAFDQRGDLAAVAWADLQRFETNKKKAYFAQKGEEEVRKHAHRDMLVSQEKYQTVTKNHMLVLKKRELQNQKARQQAQKDLAMALLADEGFELEEDTRPQVMQLPQGSTADSKGSLAKLDNQRHRDN